MAEPKYIEMPELGLRRCIGCANYLHSVGTSKVSCETFMSDNDLRDCTDNHLVFVRNTPKGRAVYVATRLEANND